MDRDVEFYRGLIDGMTDGVYFVDRNRRITFWSAGAAKMTGYPAEAVVGQPCGAGVLNHVDDRGRPLCSRNCPLTAVLTEGRKQDIRMWMHHAEGHRQPVWVRASPILDEDGRVTGVVEVFSDDTAMNAARTRMAELEELALADPLTGVGNRRYLMTQLAARLDEFVRYGWPFGVLFADLDHFKKINDLYGHEAGDSCIKVVAHTLAYALRSSDMVARYGGEEFVAVIAHADQTSLAATAERLRGLVATSRAESGERSIRMTISIGGALVLPGDDVEALLRRADTQLYAAKAAGRNRIAITADPAGAPTGRSGSDHAGGDTDADHGTDQKTATASRSRSERG